MTSRGFYDLAGSARGQYEANAVFWLIPESASLARLGKSAWSGLTKFVTFGQCRRWKKAAEENKKKENIEDTRGFIVVQTQMAFFLGSPNAKRKLSFLILMNAKSVCHMISPLLIKVVQLIWPRCFLAFL